MVRFLSLSLNFEQRRAERYYASLKNRMRECWDLKIKIQELKKKLSVLTGPNG